MTARYSMYLQYNHVSANVLAWRTSENTFLCYVFVKRQNKGIRKGTNCNMDCCWCILFSTFKHHSWTFTLRPNENNMSYKTTYVHFVFIFMIEEQQKCLHIRVDKKTLSKVTKSIIQAYDLLFGCFRLTEQYENANTPVVVVYSQILLLTL